jgi:hypothetical protein
MKKNVFIWILVLICLACGQDKETLTVIDGKNGTNGQNGQTGVDGRNGHSIVTFQQEASSCECETSGTRIDMYSDIDDSLTASENDVYLNSLVVCNGRNGLDGARGRQGQQGDVGPRGLPGSPGMTGAQGPVGPVGQQGPQGMQGPSGSSATITSYSSSNCTLISGTSSYVKPNGHNYKLYASSSCSSNSAFAEVSEGESYWVSSTTLAVWNDGSLRVIKFN